MIIRNRTTKYLSALTGRQIFLPSGEKSWRKILLDKSK